MPAWFAVGDDNDKSGSHPCFTEGIVASRIDLLVRRAFVRSELLESLGSVDKTREYYTRKCRLFQAIVVLDVAAESETRGYHWVIDMKA